MPAPQNDVFCRHDQAVYSMWMHFVDFCVASAETATQAHAAPSHKRATPPCFSAPDTQLNAYTQLFRLPAFRSLSQGMSLGEREGEQNVFPSIAMLGAYDGERARESATSFDSLDDSLFCERERETEDERETDRESEDSPLSFSLSHALAAKLGVEKKEKESERDSPCCAASLWSDLSAHSCDDKTDTEREFALFSALCSPAQTTTSCEIERERESPLPWRESDRCASFSTISIW